MSSIEASKFRAGATRKSPKWKALKSRLNEFVVDRRIYGTPVSTVLGDFIYEVKDRKVGRIRLYRRKLISGKEELIFDPALTSFNSSYQLTSFVVSPDGKHVALGLNKGGTDWNTWLVLDLEQAQVLPDKLLGIKWLPPRWSADSKGLYYVRFLTDQKKPAEFLLKGSGIYYHAIGTQQVKDKLFYQPDDPEKYAKPSITDDGNYLIAELSKSSGNENINLIFNLKNLYKKPLKLKPQKESFFHFIHSKGTQFYFLTNIAAPNRRLVKIDIRHRDPLASMKTVIDEKPFPLSSASFIMGKFYLKYMKNAASSIQIYSKTGQYLKPVKVPSRGAIKGFNGYQNIKTIPYVFQSYLNTREVYFYDVNTGHSQLMSKLKMPFDNSKYSSRLVWYKGVDGDMVPMSLVSKKGIKRNLLNPTILSGYGCYGTIKSATFDRGVAAWLEQGGVYAVAHIRGGGALGDKWYQQGKGSSGKITGLGDFVLAARFLIADKITQPKKLGIIGASCGGTLVTAAINKAPELFAAIVAINGTYDITNFHNLTGGYLWKASYGDPDNPSDLKNILRYSPLQNVQSKKYPHYLLMVGENDTRVPPKGHSYKLYRRLKERVTNPENIQMFIYPDAGHSLWDLSFEERINWQADIFGFFADKLI